MLPPALEKALPTVTVNEKQRLSLELSEFFSDIEGQAISFSATPVKGFTLSKAGLLAGVPADTSSTELAFTATDSGSAVSAHKIVINVNAAPVWTNVASQSFTVGDTVKIELATAFSDREGNALTLQAANLPAGLTLTGNTISGAPTTSGEFKVSIQATDAGGAVGSGTMTYYRQRQEVWWFYRSSVFSTVGGFSHAASSQASCHTLRCQGCVIGSLF